MPPVPSEPEYDPPPYTQPPEDSDFYDSDDDKPRRDRMSYESGDEVDELDDMDDPDIPDDLEIDLDVLDDTVYALDRIIRGDYYMYM